LERKGQILSWSPPTFKALFRPVERGGCHICVAIFANLS
jgi:hypothetical protein